MALEAPIDYYGQMANVPDPGKKFEEGMAWAQKQKELQKAQARQAQMEADYTTLISGPMTAVKLRDFTFKYPEVGDKFKGAIDALSADEKKAAVQQFLPAATALYSGDAKIAEQQLRTTADAYQNAGNAQMAKLYGDAAESIKISPDQANVVLSMMANAIDPEWAGKVDASRKTGVDIKKAEAEALKAATGSGIEVHSVKVYPNGTTVVIGKGNEKQITNARGDVLTGADADAAVQAGLNSEIRLAGGRAGAEAMARGTAEAAVAPAIAGGTEAGKAGVQAGNAALQTATKISGQLANLRRARELAKGGADTGVIASRLPNWSASSIELANMRNQLGLDVIGQATFGALSEGELNLALNTALPTNLNEADLVTWLDSKIAAQEKMRSEMMKAAKFLSKPGNTLDKWLEQNGGAPAGAAPANDLAAAAAAELARRRGGG